MATVIAVYNSDGCVGRCDARCHNAKGFDCHCICGGALHGVGERIAQEDVQFLLANEVIDEAHKLGIDGQLRVWRLTKQLNLFEP